jgi:hypothetical protein
VASGREGLLSKHEALTSNPIIAKEKKRKKKKFLDPPLEMYIYFYNSVSINI